MSWPGGHRRSGRTIFVSMRPPPNLGEYLVLAPFSRARRVVCTAAKYKTCRFFKEEATGFIQEKLLQIN